MIKVGTSSLIREEVLSPNLTSLARVCETVKELKQSGALDTSVEATSYGACGTVVAHYSRSW